MEGEKEPIEQATGDARHSIDFFLEDDGDVVEEHIANDAASGSRDGAHDDSHPEGVVHIECLLHAGNGEEGESEGVEDKPRVVEALHVSAEDDDECLGYDGAENVDGVCHPEGGDTQQHIADGASADCHSDAADESAKPVELFGGGMPDARDGEGEGAEKFDYDEEIVQRSKFKGLFLAVGTLALQMVEDYLAHTHGFWRYLDELVSLDVFKTFLK